MGYQQKDIYIYIPKPGVKDNRVKDNMNFCFFDSIFDSNDPIELNR
nr:NADH-plastoquinone oxidoreductase subunit 4L [Scenedesmaceae sp. YH-2023b]